MSVSVRSSLGIPATGGLNGASKGDRSTRLSQTAQNILGANKRGGHTSQDHKNMAVIGIDELQRIRQQCTGYAGASTGFYGTDLSA